VRWRMLDRVDDMAPWAHIAGRKAVSLEEYMLLEPFGRRGVLPESLILASCVDLARWLVAASSAFALTATLREVQEFDLARTAGMGQVLELTADVRDRRPDALALECGATCAGKPVAQGRLVMAFVPAGECFEPAALAAAWEELYGKA
jgi:hypothetical protein